MPNRINYQLEMEKVLRTLDGTRPKLLLHACCAPCSSATLERLSAHFDLTILYYNPNIYPPEEYHRREAELERFVEQAGYHYPVVELPYDPQEFYTAVKGLENEPERGARCTVCYRLRLEQTMNMQEGEARCTQLVVEPSRFGHLTLLGSCTPKPISGWSADEQSRGRVITASGGLSLPQGSFSFDKRSGRPLSPSTCVNGCITVTMAGYSVAEMSLPRSCSLSSKSVAKRSSTVPNWPPCSPAAMTAV